MSWANVCGAINTAIFGTFGISAEYSAGGIGDPLPVIVVLSRNAVAVGDYGGVVEMREQVRFSRSEVSAPAHGDTVTIGDEVFIIDQIDPERSDDLAVACWVR